MAGVVQLSLKPLSSNHATDQEQSTVKHNQTGKNIQKACLFLAALGLFLSILIQ
jgi:beta-lactamase regulating signal transducer with metallopeptidase domain